jgi:hypothetical protein
MDTILVAATVGIETDCATEYVPATGENVGVASVFENVAVTVHALLGMVPVKVEVPDPPHPETLVIVDPPEGVTVQV